MGDLSLLRGNALAPPRRRAPRHLEDRSSTMGSRMPGRPIELHRCNAPDRSRNHTSFALDSAVTRWSALQPAGIFTRRFPVRARCRPAAVRLPPGHRRLFLRGSEGVSVDGTFALGYER